MDVSNISLSDINRILMGDAPYAFLPEVVIRTLIIYFVLLVVIRIMGKRMTGQLTLTEMAVMIGLGAIISIPAQAYDRGILQGALLLVLVLGFQRGATLLYTKSVRFEKLLQGDETLLVKNGTILVPQLDSAKITREQLFAILRNKGVYNLGQVKRLYQESCGLFSVYTEQNPKPGLSILPGADKEFLSAQRRPDSRMQACNSCGNTSLPPENMPHVCKLCGNEKWEPVVI